MTLLIRLVLSALFLLGTPSAAAPCGPCASVDGSAASSSRETAAQSALSGAPAALIRADRARGRPCTVALMDHNDQLVALHRSIRDGGLGVLRVPASASGYASTAAIASSPAGCDAG